MTGRPSRARVDTILSPTKVKRKIDRGGVQAALSVDFKINIYFLAASPGPIKQDRQVDPQFSSAPAVRPHPRQPRPPAMPVPVVNRLD